MMVERKLRGTVDESSADQEIHKSVAVLHNLWTSIDGLPSINQALCELKHCWYFNSLTRISQKTDSRFLEMYILYKNCPS